jgi:hypothetical protein
MKRKLLGATLAAMLAFSPSFATLVNAQDASAKATHTVSTGSRFTKLSVSSVGGFVAIPHWSFSLEADGTYSYTRFNEPAVTGKATKHELAKVNAAWKSAKLEQGAHQLPGYIPDMPTTTLAYDYKTMGGVPVALSGSYSGAVNFPANAAKVLNALYAIRDRVENETSALAFNEIDYSVSGGFVPNAYSAKLKITNDGKVHFEQSAINAKYAPIDGQLTAQERQKLNAAFKGAQVDSLPKNVSAHIVPDASMFTIDSKVGANSYSFEGFSVGDYGSYNSRVKPLVDEIYAIMDRLKATTTTATAGATGVLNGNP